MSVRVTRTAYEGPFTLRVRAEDAGTEITPKARPGGH
jgi:hypothetical protein